MKTRITILLAAILFGFAGVSGQSFWIDEAGTAFFAQSKNFDELVEKLAQDGGSSAQMPLYMLGLWIWEKIWGSAEWTLRAFNLPWWGLSLLAWLGLTGKRAHLRPWLWIGALLSPFLFYYLDEARPYIMQFAGATLMWVAVLRFYDECVDLSGWVLLYTGCVLLCGSSLLGVPFAGCLFLLAAWLLSRYDPKFSWMNTPWILSTGVFVACMLGVIGYYVWTFTLGAKASNVGHTDLKNILFAIYELLGCSGWGPGRLALRSEGVAAFTGYWPMIVLYVTIMALGVILVFKRKEGGLRMKWRNAIPFVPVVLVPVMFVLVLGYISGFRVLGRHLMPILPALILVCALLSEQLWKLTKGRVLLISMALLFLGSGLQVRFSQRFAKDDYRTAALTARQETERGGTVWWAADRAGANYYGLDPSLPSSAIPFSESGRVIFANNREKNLLDQLPEPDLIILSKEDVYDKTGDLRLFIQEMGFQKSFSAAAFTFWHKDPSSAKTIK